jgi:ABC-type glycerol-3-phosphate transport system permease component
MILSPQFAVVLFVGMLLLFEAGRRIGVRMMRQPDQTPSGVGAVEGAVFGLLGLLIAFTFSGAVSRFDDRRHLIVEEANDIGTAWLRLDLLPADTQPRLRQLFRDYLSSRLETYRKLPDIAAAKQELARSTELQSEIWTAAVGGCKQAESPACSILLLPALNQMIDITTTRTMVAQFHPPIIIFILLGVLALASSMLAGYGMSTGRRSWLHIIAFAFLLTLAIYVILDIEYPRFGLIRVDAADQVLKDLLESMK